MRFLNTSNIKKTLYYLERNGVIKTLYAVTERISGKEEIYSFQETGKELLEEQRKYQFTFPCKFSILVPAYETKEEYLRALIDSVLSQTYGNFELIIADAGKSGKTEQVVSTYSDKRIIYFRLKANGGISENTNEALKRACGDYIGLLDHDDLLTPDALFEMAKAIENKKKTGKEYGFLYSDEDKCDSGGMHFFEPHKKTGFNLDLLLSNNYMCHFMLMKAELMKELSFRKEYDGAQDYDLFLRAVEKLVKEYGYRQTREKICHIPKILYHWRCHEGSTAVNPRSKEYAYEAGKRAVRSFCNAMEWDVRVTESEHLGFYKIITDDIFEKCGKVAAVGGKVINEKKRIKAGIYKRSGKIPFGGLRLYEGGPMHRASLKQTAYALDLRCIKVNPEWIPVFEEVTGLQYTESGKAGLFWWKKYKKSDEEWKCLSLAFGERLAKSEYRLIFVPDYICKTGKHGELKWQRQQS
ncbi:MAG: glycosyltransferase [Lachnospiraceae bacterium]|nr:glycosyltransferase [Lachnospiraceae bacterium]